MYNETIRSFLPTPSKSHYLFNLRDFSRVIQVNKDKQNFVFFKYHMICFFFLQGILLLNPKVLRAQINDEDSRFNSLKIIKLWTHEAYRVFADRLVDSNDRTLFFNTIKVNHLFLLKKKKEENQNNLLKRNRQAFFLF
jgi:dynein heavy chain